MVRRAQAALRSVEHTSVRQLRVLAAIVFLFAMVIATVAPAVTAPMAFADSSTSSSSVDYATWAEVSKAMDKQLNSGLKTYNDGNTAGATSDFMARTTRLRGLQLHRGRARHHWRGQAAQPNSRHSKAFRIFPTRLATTINWLSRLMR